jgi:hypothetical protein
MVAGGPTFTSTFDVNLLLPGVFPEGEVAALFSENFPVVLLGFISNIDGAEVEVSFVGFVSMTEDVVATVFLPPSAQRKAVM